MPISINDYKQNFQATEPNLAYEQELFAKYPGPYSILSAGAGTGKTYTIQAKIDWLLNSANFDIKDILALSFTRTAANNLAKRYPGVTSLTFDAFSADIFQEAFPAGKDLVIAEDLTVLNSMNSINDYNGFANIPANIRTDILSTLKSITPTSRFKTIPIDKVIGELTRVISLYQNEFKDMLIKSGVVSFNIRKAFTTANAMQTLPPKYQSIAYLIIDEAQDSTQPETVMALTLALNNDWRIAIVGDASQNISEWRGVSPDAFIESQHLGGFGNFALQSNYRSEYPILHAANQLLNYTETNETAQIQLTTPTPHMALTDEFKQHVHLYRAIGTPFSYNDLNHSSSTTPFSDNYTYNELPIGKIATMIQNARQNDESFAILARTNMTVDIIKAELDQYGVSMFTKPQSKRALTFQTDTLNLIAEHSHDLTSLISQLTNDTVINVTMKKVMRNVYPSSVQKFKTNIRRILANHSIVKLVQANNFNQIILAIQYLMIRIEAKENAQRQQLETSDDTNQLANQDYVITTFHSSKGLEWDNVIIIDQSVADSNRRNKKGSQEDLRLAYVAITRAKKQLHILSLEDDATSHLISNTKPSVVQNPYVHAYILGLKNTLTKNGHEPDLTTELQDYSYIENTHSTI